MNTSTTTMSEPMTATDDDGGWIESPVDDETYNIIMALASKLEAIDTYRVYASDGEPELWRELADDEGRNAKRLFSALQERLAR